MLFLNWYPGVDEPLRRSSLKMTICSKRKTLRSLLRDRTPVSCSVTKKVSCCSSLPWLVNFPCHTRPHTVSMKISLPLSLTIFSASDYLHYACDGWQCIAPQNYIKQVPGDEDTMKSLASVSCIIIIIKELVAQSLSTGALSPARLSSVCQHPCRRPWAWPPSLSTLSHKTQRTLPSRSQANTILNFNTITAKHRECAPYLRSQRFNIAAV